MCLGGKAEKSCLLWQLGQQLALHRVNFLPLLVYIFDGMVFAIDMTD
jgi:hypothetical protein